MNQTSRISDKPEARNLPALPSSASKAEELEHLLRFTSTLHSQTYLGGLFSGGMIDWIADRIRNDWSTDLMGELDNAEKINRELVSNAEGLRTTRDAFQDRVVVLQKTVTERDATIADLKDSVNLLIGDLNDAHAATAAREDELIERIDQMREEDAAEIARLTSTVRDLKAMLWDKEHPAA